MRSGWVIAIALLVGLLVAGLMNAALVSLLPERLRGVPLIWVVTTVIVFGALWIGWRIGLRRHAR